MHSKNLITVLIILSVVVIMYLVVIYPLSRREKFQGDNIDTGLLIFDQYGIEKNRTKLYGSLFLDNLKTQIKNMTDPRIEYDDKQIILLRYSDVLL